MEKDRDFEEEMTESEMNWMRMRDVHASKMEEWRNRYPIGSVDNMSKETREELTARFKKTIEKEKLEDEQENKLSKGFK